MADDQQTTRWRLDYHYWKGTALLRLLAPRFGHKGKRTIWRNEIHRRLYETAKQMGKVKHA